MALIQVTDLKKVFGEQVVLSDINFEVKDGDVRVLMGASGSGKSTILHCINRLEDPTSGSIIFRGKEVAGPDVDVRALRKQIGFVFQQFALYSHLTVLDNVSLALRILEGMSKPQANDKALQELSRFDMTAHQHKYPSQLSGGQQQRVAIARALVTEPAMVLADEPTGALDTASTLEILELLHELNRKGTTVVVITHEEEVARAARRVIRLRDGEVIEDRTWAA